MLQYGRTLKTLYQEKKSGTKDYVLYDPIDMKCSE